MKGAELRGLVPIELGGETFQLCYDLNALCEVEDRYGDIETAFSQQLGVKAARFLLWAGLQHSHADRFPTEQDVGRVVSLANVKYVAERLGEAIRVALPEPEKDSKK